MLVDAVQRCPERGQCLDIAFSGGGELLRLAEKSREVAEMAVAPSLADRVPLKTFPSRLHLL